MPPHKRQRLEQPIGSLDSALACNIGDILKIELPQSTRQESDCCIGTFDRPEQEGSINSDIEERRRITTTEAIDSNYKVKGRTIEANVSQDANEMEEKMQNVKSKPPQICSVQSDVAYKTENGTKHVNNNLGRKGSASLIPTVRPRTYTVKLATVLFIDIKACLASGYSSACEWVAAFYERIDAAAAAHGVSKAEVRGDCCICVAGVEGVVPYAALADAAADPACDQATRMLAFAVELHAALAADATAADDDGGPAPIPRMGIATGELAFLLTDAGGAGAGGAGALASVQGDTVNVAARMESLAEPGAALVHKSAADRWAAEGVESPAGRRRTPPATVCVEVKGRGLQRAAVFDCAAGSFRTAAVAAAFPAAIACPTPRAPPPTVYIPRISSAP